MMAALAMRSALASLFTSKHIKGLTSLTGLTGIWTGKKLYVQFFPHVKRNKHFAYLNDRAHAIIESSRDMSTDQNIFIPVPGQVGRRGRPKEDAEAVLRVSDAVGPAVALRADANRRWTLEEALQFGHAVKGAGLEVTLLSYVNGPRGSRAFPDVIGP
jgi:hypothetical protein